MRTLLTGRKMKAVDHYTIHEVGIPSLVLMERAALAVADCALKGSPSICRTQSGLGAVRCGK